MANKISFLMSKNVVSAILNWVHKTTLSNSIVLTITATVCSTTKIYTKNLTQRNIAYYMCLTNAWYANWSWRKNPVTEFKMKKMIRSMNFWKIALTLLNMTKMTLLCLSLERSKFSVALLVKEIIRFKWILEWYSVLITNSKSSVGCACNLTIQGKYVTWITGR